MIGNSVTQTVLRNPIHFISFGFGVGLSPIAPGTMGTLIAIPIFLALTTFSLSIYLLFVTIIFFVGCWASGLTAKALGVPDFTPHTDTLTQTIDQELIDINTKRDDEDKEDRDGPEIKPITLEVDEQYAEGEKLDFNMMSALDKIRDNQAKRSGLVARDIIKDNKPMLANKGGLAGLFRVKNQ